MSFEIKSHGIARFAVFSPELKPADTDFNTDIIIKCMNDAAENNCYACVFPELSLTGYTCADLFFNRTLINSIEPALIKIAESSKTLKSISIVGAPFSVDGKLFNCAVFISRGNILGVVPKTYIPNSNEYYEERWFSSEYDRAAEFIKIDGKDIPFGADIIFSAENFKNLQIGIEICEDLWAVQPPGSDLAAAGASVLVNLSAGDEFLGKADYRRSLVISQSGRCIAAYLYSAAGPGESSTDLVFSGHSIIAENGNLLAEADRFNFETQVIYSDIDIEKLIADRIRNSTFAASISKKIFREIPFRWHATPVNNLYRNISKTPFVPQGKTQRADVCREIVNIQSTALAKRLKHINIKNVVIGVSGGLDSTLALLVCVKAFDKLKLDKKGIQAVTMPGFGTSKRTKSNAETLAEQLGANLKMIDINESSRLHFRDIGHDESNHNVVYENTQARMRTMLLMNIANQVSGIVIGTGDLSEAALGWATYNGDHISMYSVNSGVPKTLVKYIVEWFAEEVFNGDTSNTLIDICNTPISPELIPTNEQDEITQVTESFTGPYILNDFFLYWFIRFGFSPAKLYFLAQTAFEKDFSNKELLETLENFIKRFFANQYKRSCVPDGIKTGSVALSPRGDWRMPSDASLSIWLKDIQNLKNKEL